MLFPHWQQGSQGNKVGFAWSDNRLERPSPARSHHHLLLSTLKFISFSVNCLYPSRWQFTRPSDPVPPPPLLLQSHVCVCRRSSPCPLSGIYFVGTHKLQYFPQATLGYRLLPLLRSSIYLFLYFQNFLLSGQMSPKSWAPGSRLLRVYSLTEERASLPPSPHKDWLAWLVSRAPPGSGPVAGQRFYSKATFTRIMY